MACDRIQRISAEYVSRQLNNRKARFARDPVYRPANRVFGYIGPDVAYYKECQDGIKADFARQGVKIASDFRYTVDIGTMPQQAANAVVQMKAAGVSTIILATDFIMTINLTQQAFNQQWGPEWIVQGVGFQDLDGFGRLFNQDRVNGSMLGLSQLGGNFLGPTSEAGRLYRRLTGRDMPAGTDGDYAVLVHLFNMLQGAGPDLRPDSLPRGFSTYPASGPPDLAYGLWSFRTSASGASNTLDHTAVDDARQVYWDGAARGPDGRQGTYIALYGGRRFGVGQFPAEEPPAYPGR